MRNFLLGISLVLSLHSFAQVEESKLGSWYMYFYNVNFEESNFGVQGDFQYRNWNTIGDLEQLLLRSGVTYRPDEAPILFTLGFANITTGTPGESSSTFNENRVYQEALINQKILQRVHLLHRFRYEQRWVEDQDFRTRFRYNLFVNIGLNSKELVPRTFYASFYNELFINGERDTGTSEVELFDRNRTYFGLGYVLTESTRLQLGWMRQETETFTKNQLQFSLHQNLNF
ncbi:DUF2490 domain-containing protein [Psychroflexus montanilacus]|uniref:DUF2490 domain-containing protein n=1 Tax=Psychroflexus montanilacus TaxID=2873598 RepID=UPI001CCA8A92|nr:DUF2490 domain-containing protein [Psychroflexus montanilacus]MBZ9651036.1 DUF2490 domain-containing protein [Psychroflexus montanilacus]